MQNTGGFLPSHTNMDRDDLRRQLQLKVGGLSEKPQRDPSELPYLEDSNSATPTADAMRRNFRRQDRKVRAVWPIWDQMDREFDEQTFRNGPQGSLKTDSETPRENVVSIFRKTPMHDSEDKD